MDSRFVLAVLATGCIVLAMSSVGVAVPKDAECSPECAENTTCCDNRCFEGLCTCCGDQCFGPEGSQCCGDTSASGACPPGESCCSNGDAYPWCCDGDSVCCPDLWTCCPEELGCGDWDCGLSGQNYYSRRLPLAHKARPLRRPRS